MGNNFSADSNCKALWRFEDGALVTDSKGGNTLEALGTPVVDTENYKEGAASVELPSIGDFLRIADADLDAGFPLKNGDTTKDFSLCAWAYLTTQPANSRTVYRKKGTNTMSLQVIFYWSDPNIVLRLALSSNGTAWTNNYNHASGMSLNQWYHIGVTYDGGDYSYRLRVWDESAQQILGTDLVGTGIDPFVGNGEVTLSANDVSTFWNWIGNLDEVVVFNDVLTVNEIDQIRAGTYGAGGNVVPLAAVIAATGGLAGSSGVERKLSGAIAGMGGISPTSQVQRALSAILAGLGNLAGTAKVDRSLIAAMAGTGGVAGTLSVTKLNALAGAIAAAGNVAGAVHVVRRMFAIIAGQGGLSGTLRADWALTGGIQGKGKLAGSLSGVGSSGPTLRVQGREKHSHTTGKGVSRRRVTL